MTTDETNISSATPKQNRGLIKKTILLGLFGLFLFSLEAHHPNNYIGGVCHHDRTSKRAGGNRLPISMHCYMGIDGSEKKVVDPKKVIEIINKYKSGNTIYEIFIYEIILDGEVEEGKNQEIEIALKKQNKEIALISTEEKILCEKPKDNLLCVATNQKK